MATSMTSPFANRFIPARVLRAITDEDGVLLTNADQQALIAYIPRKEAE